MRLLPATAFVLIAALFAAHAQTNPPANPPPAAAAKAAPKAPEGKRSTGVVTPDRLIGQMENFAKTREDGGRPALPRGTTFFLLYADNASELAALGRYSILVLSVLTQKPEELPLKRVYIRAKDQDIPLTKLSSWRSEVSNKPLVQKMYGSYREDGLYLFPTGMALRDGQLRVDFAANSTGLPLLQLPVKDPPERVKTFQNSDPAPNAKPNLLALQKFLARKTSGFPAIKSLP
jgi:hypothetical protein